MVCGSRSKRTRQLATDNAHASAQKELAAHQDARPQSSQPTITSAVAADPPLPPTKAAKRLFPLPSATKRGLIRFRIKEQLEEGRGKHWVWDKGAVHDANVEPDDDEIERVRQRFGYKPIDKHGPSRLYLMILADCMLPLPRNPMSGVVSPPLLATTGIVPLSIFSTGPDIIGHYYDCIVAARKEVILLTNYWQGGKNVDKISEALVELNRRAEQRRRQKAASQIREKAPVSQPNGGAKANGDAHDDNIDEVDVGPPSSEEKLVVKIMWDRGPRTLADLFRLRKPVPPSAWKANGLPQENEIANLSLEILNYHRPLMGTFHAKLLIVDRKVALINSNNIQDRPNIEACVRLEGDIVNSVYDHALISWGNRLNPPLPCLSEPAPVSPSPSAFIAGNQSTLPAITAEKMREKARSTRLLLQEQDEATEDEKERSLQSPLGRLHFGEMVDQVMRRDSFSKAGTPTSPAESHRGGGGSDPTSPESEGAARRAGALWAQKVLGERFSYFQSMRQGSAEGEQPNPQNRRHLADVVEALMKKEGIKPGGWADGALEVFGLGPSSSRNVALEVRRNPRPRNLDPAARGLRIPRSVAEEAPKDDEDDETAGDPNPAQGQHEPSEVDQVTRKSTDSSTSLDEAPSQTAVESSASPKMVDSLIEDEQGKKIDDSGPKVFPTGDESPSGKKATLGPIPTKSVEEHKDGDGQVDHPAPRIATSDLALATMMSANDGSAIDDTKDDDDGAPGSFAYRRIHRRTLSNLSKSSAAERLSMITKSLDFANNSKVQGEIQAPENLSDEALRAVEEVLDFQPYTFHDPHEPVPMALVNRRPHGTPGHSDIRNPQDASWLAGFRYAKEHVFIQSPTLNASPIKAAVLACVRRHVRVELWLDLGFNDKSESMPFQGGTNEQVITSLYRQLRREGKGDEKYLEVFWYTGKDMTRPLNAVRKQRNCHVKFAAFDGQVAILGSGNQDTQSWFHSQEINVMLDSRKIVAEMMLALRRNQSTHIYGKVDQKDGIWRGRDGAGIVDTGRDEPASR